MANQSEAMKENELLRAQAARFDGAAPTRAIDAKRIAPSVWANRHESSFETSEFASFKAEIAQAGGNVQPIKVRPLPVTKGQGGQGVGPSYAHGVEFEIVFGHRRHRACLDLGIPVLAMVEEATEQKLFVQMERENRNRTDLSAWEQGVMYARALDQGLYASNRQLAASIGRDLTDVGRALSLARLPQAVIDAFGSPLDLQFRWAKPLNDLQQSDPEGLLKRAKSLAGKKLGGKDVLATLLGGGGIGPSYPPTEIKRAGSVIGTMMTSSTGLITLKLLVPLTEEQRGKLQQMVEEL
jgi:ParB family chromosome partitioning protein